jgi:hypothetical protein
MKLNGDEKIELVIKRQELDTQDTVTHRHTFYISEIVDFARTRNGSNTYTIRAVSKHLYVNNSKTLTESKEGTIGTIIQSICKSDLKITKMDINTSTDQNIKCIIPKLRPLAAINWLNSNAYTINGAPFYFYETLVGKVKYKSYEDFVDVTPEDIKKREYIHTPRSTSAAIGSPEYYSYEARRVRKISSDLNLSKFVATSEGAYSSSTKSIDIATKKINDRTFTYKSNFQLNDNDPFPKRNNNDQYGGRAVNELHSGKNYFISNNSLSYKSSEFQAPAVTGIGRSQSYISTEDTLTHDIVIAGNFLLESGQIMKLQINKSGAEDNTSDPLDKMQSGKYLITSIIHKFGNEYTQQLEIKTNSFAVSLTEILEVSKEEVKEVKTS